MKVLVLNDFFVGWSGSEIVALEVAEYFDAVCSSFWVDEPMRSELPNWLPLNEIDLRDYDYVWAQHHTILVLLDRLSDGDLCPSISIISLSPFEPNERPLPSICEAYADTVYANSLETRDSIDLSAKVFGNAAPSKFHVKRSFGQLQKVLFVGNHPTSEMLEASNLLRQKGVGVRFIGQHAEIKRVDVYDILKADVIVTIGKTVRYALASGTPVFIYDHLGGDGYLTDENYADNEHFNFSGRPSCRRLSAEELAAEIYDNYRVWTPPPQPVLEEFLSEIIPVKKPFKRTKDTSALAALAASLGNWIMSAHQHKQAASGDFGSWSWLGMCLRKKLLRTTGDIRARLTSRR